VLGWTASEVLLIAGAAVHSVGAGGSIDGVPMGSTGYALAGITLLLLGGAVWLASTAAMFLPGLPVAAGSTTEPSLGTVPA